MTQVHWMFTWLILDPYPILNRVNLKNLVHPFLICIHKLTQYTVIYRYQNTIHHKTPYICNHFSSSKEHHPPQDTLYTITTTSQVVCNWKPTSFFIGKKEVGFQLKTNFILIPNLLKKKDYRSHSNLQDGILASHLYHNICHTNWQRKQG